MLASPQGQFTERDAAGIMKQLLEFLQYAHNKNVVHRDIKPENLILLDDNAGGGSGRGAGRERRRGCEQWGPSMGGIIGCLLHSRFHPA